MLDPYVPTEYHSERLKIVSEIWLSTRKKIYTSYSLPENPPMSFGLNSVLHEVLLYFIETCLEADELERMMIEGIKNTRALLHITDIISIVDLHCDAINNIKQRICFDTKNKGFAIKKRIKCGIQGLIGTLR